MVIAIEDDFDLDKIIGCGQCFRPRRLADGRYLFLTGRHCLHLVPLADGRLRADCTPRAWQEVWAPYFDLGRDYAAIRRAIPPADTFLRAAAAEGAGIRILRQNAWEMLVTFILSQRKSIPAIRTAVEQLCTRFGRPLTGHGAGEFAFPAPAALAAASPEALAACGLGYRVPYVQDAARQVRTGALNLAALAAADDETLLAALLGVHGVGRKVASCVGLFAYGRCACAPVDVWIERIIARQYGGQNPFCAFGENAGVLQQYLFYHALQAKSTLRPAAPAPAERGRV